MYCVDTFGVWILWYDLRISLKVISAKLKNNLYFRNSRLSEQLFVTLQWHSKHCNFEDQTLRLWADFIKSMLPRQVKLNFTYQLMLWLDGKSLKSRYNNVLPVKVFTLQE